MWDRVPSSLVFDHRGFGVWFVYQVNRISKMANTAKKLIPLLDRVLVEKVIPPTKSVGGVLLPESATSKVSWATICDAAMCNH